MGKSRISIHKFIKMQYLRRLVQWEIKAKTTKKVNKCQQAVAWAATTDAMTFPPTKAISPGFGGCHQSIRDVIPAGTCGRAS